MRAKIVDMKTRKPVFTRTEVTREEFIDLANAVESCLSELEGTPNVDTSKARSLLHELRWCAANNRKFRIDTYPELEELFYELHERAQTKI